MPLHPFLVRTRLYRLFLALTRPFHKVYTYVSYLSFVHEHKAKGKVNDYYNAKAAYPRRFMLHDALLEQIGEQPINYFEFGVAGGNMIRHWSAKQQHPDSLFTGFDSFEGLPESWEGKGEGHFDQKGNFPQIDDERVRFVKGWFQDSVGAALRDARFEGMSVYHLDADLFSSTLFVLFQIHDQLKPGDLLIFDEYSSHEHEHKAFELFKQCCSQDLRFDFVDAVNNYRQVAFRVQ